MARLFLSALLLSLFACATQGAGETLLLQYEDFGPPSAAHELIGMDWWQWQDHADSRPRRYDIKVVVYRFMELPQVRRLFPSDPARELDYRYVSYLDAMDYLERMIEENAIESLTSQLQSTRTRILSVLGEHEVEAR
jgi:hypothetical protein